MQSRTLPQPRCRRRSVRGWYGPSLRAHPHPTARMNLHFHFRLHGHPRLNPHLRLSLLHRGVWLVLPRLWKVVRRGWLNHCLSLSSRSSRKSFRGKLAQNVLRTQCRHHFLLFRLPRLQRQHPLVLSGRRRMLLHRRNSNPVYPFPRTRRSSFHQRPSESRTLSISSSDTNTPSALTLIPAQARTMMTIMGL